MINLESGEATLQQIKKIFRTNHHPYQATSTKLGTFQRGRSGKTRRLSIKEIQDFEQKLRLTRLRLTYVG